MPGKKKSRDQKAMQKQKVKMEMEAQDEEESDDQFQNAYEQSKHEMSDRKHPKKHKSKKRQRNDAGGQDRVNKFFDDEAEEGTDSGDEGHSNKLMSKDQYYSKEQLQRRTKGVAQKVAEMEKRIQKKHQHRENNTIGGGNRYDADGNLLKSSQRNRNLDDGDLDDEDLDDEVDGYEEANDLHQEDYQDSAKLALLPSTNDPKIWQLKVKRGMQSTPTMAILNKCADFARRGKPLEILSATCTDNIENFIYVEAFKKNHVFEAVNGLNFCLGKIEILSLSEMTKIYEPPSVNRQSVPEPRNWVRIKSGVYEKDLGVVEKIINDEKVWVKLIPRIDPQHSKSSTTFKKGYIQKLPQRAFNPSIFKDAIKQSSNGPSNVKSFYQWKNMFFRKGFLYKIFTVKQLDCDNVKPSLDERSQFLDIFEQNLIGKAHNSINQGDDSSEVDADTTRKFYKQDFSSDFCQGDKIQVIEGELQGSQGIIQKFENEQVVFKPTNLEGFEENLAIEKTCVEKYFEQGDLVRLIEGKYKGETGMVTAIIKDKKEQFPVIKLDKSQRELKAKKNYLRLKTDNDKDLQRLVEMGTKMKISGNLGDDRIGENYKVGELIMFNGNKTYGYILAVQDDFVKILNDQGVISRVRLTEIDKKLPFDRKAYTRDQMGNGLGIDDVVKCVDQSAYKGRKGIIKNICKSCVFLWDPKDFAQSNGIFCESTRNIQILGTEFLKGDNQNSAVAGLNRIMRDKLTHKQVMILKGPFKGQRGIVSKVNGDEAIIELSTRTKKVQILKNDLFQVDEDCNEVESRYQNQNNGGQSQYQARGGFGGGGTQYGGQSIYGGGQTAYDAGKTPMAYVNTPMHQYNNGGQTPAQPGWGAGGNTGAYQSNDFLDQNQGIAQQASNWGNQDQNSQPNAGNWGQGGGYTPGGQQNVIKNEQTAAW